MKKLLARLLLRVDPATYQLKDGSLAPTLTTLDLIGLGTGMVVWKSAWNLGSPNSSCPAAIAKGESQATR